MKFVHRKAGDVAVLELSGELIGGPVGQSLHAETKRLLAEGSRKILLSMKDLTWINSSGLGYLASCYSSVRQAGGRMKVVHLSKRVRSIITITKLDQILEISETEAQALAEFQEAGRGT